MGCNCGKKIGSFERPIVAGHDVLGDPQPYVLQVGYAGSGYGDLVYVRGTAVGVWIERGIIREASVPSPA